MFLLIVTQRHTVGGVTGAIIGVLYQSFLPDLLQPGDIFMQQKIYQLYPELKHAPNTEGTRQLLIEAAQEAWRAIKDRVLIRLSETMPHRVRAVIEAEGWYTKY